MFQILFSYQKIERNWKMCIGYKRNLTVKKILTKNNSYFYSKLFEIEKYWDL